MLDRYHAMPDGIVTRGAAFRRIPCNIVYQMRQIEVRVRANREGKAAKGFGF